MPLPDTMTEIKLPKPPKGFSIRVTTWDYGEVAEILHIGPYEKEAPAVDRLKKFIGRSGCSIIGEHEEQYLKGPGLLFRGNPKDFHTIIRYRVIRNDTAALAIVY
jgi:hypothetical protein